MKNPGAISQAFDAFDRANLMGNTMLHWFRHMLFPGKED
jgi:hypothetical protein